jgi:Fic family protein
MKTAHITNNSFANLLPIPAGTIALLPKNLPPNIKWTTDLIQLLSKAHQALGRWQATVNNLKNPNLLIAPFAAIEAQMSTAIDTPPATIRQLYLSRLGPPFLDDQVRCAHNYLIATEHTLNAIRLAPISLTLIRQIHQILRAGLHTPNQHPGAFRTLAPPVSNAHPYAFLPPPAPQMQNALVHFDTFINDQKTHYPLLIWLAIVHYQFHAISRSTPSVPSQPQTE